MTGGDRRVRTEPYPIQADSTTQELSDAALRLSRSGGGNRVGARKTNKQLFQYRCSGKTELCKHNQGE